jgi:hypothetical protein
MFKFIANLIAAQRNATALATVKADFADMEAKFRNIVSHATGGNSADITRPLNDIAVEISALRNRIYSEGRKMERRILAGDLLHSMHDVERAVLKAMHDEIGRPLASIAEEVGLKADEVRTIVKGFVLKGLAHFGPLFDMDSGTPKGSGYLLTDEGAALKRRAVS